MGLCCVLHMRDPRRKVQGKRVREPPPRGVEASDRIPRVHAHAPCSMLHAPCSMLHAPCSLLHGSMAPWLQAFHAFQLVSSQGVGLPMLVPFCSLVLSYSYSLLSLSLSRCCNGPSRDKRLGQFTIASPRSTNLPILAVIGNGGTDKRQKRERERELFPNSP